MPEIDVSWVLDDSMFVDSFSVIRTPLLPNRQPDTANAVTMPIAGVIMPGTVEPMQQPDDATRATRWINVHTRSQLYDSIVGFAPDVVFYQGNHWKVMKQYDYSRYGSGFFAYDAILQDIAGQVVQ